MTPRYRVDRVLGRGRHAGLWLATDAGRRAPVALKIAARGCSLEAEWEALRAVAGDPVVQAFEHGALPDGRPFLALEYVGPVAAGRQPMDDEAVERWLTGAAAALAHVHRAGWVHRDVKPAHLLAREDGAIVLCDFGSACRAGACTAQAARSVIGTPRYAAPEQIEGAAASPAADTYSLGICVYELLAGQPPFRGETLTEVFSQHVRAPVPRLPRAVAHWQPLVDALLAKDPARRPADGDAVLERLAVATGEPS